uniref:50S ribosomal protein L28 n=1 Tax=Ascaris lumbricoides TaxID=6252 RepID=A0A0M3IPB6_ASCLU
MLSKSLCVDRSSKNVVLTPIVGKIRSAAPRK